MKKILGFLKKRPFLSVIVISILIHLVSGLFFGGVVLYDMLTPTEPVLEAPPLPEGIEPQKREYKIKLQKSQQQSSAPLPAPIVANISSEMSLENLDLNLNNPRSDVRVRGAGEGNGIGNGFGNGYDNGAGFDIDIDIEMTNFGYKNFVSGTLEGKLYDTKFDHRHKLKVDKKFLNDPSSIMDEMGKHTVEIVHDFTSGSWNRRGLDRKYFSPKKKLYASFWMIPGTGAASGPTAFDAQDEVTPRAILAHYSGSFVPQETGRFRLVGRGDDVLVVKVGSRIVLDGCWHNNYTKIDQGKYDVGEKLFVGEPSLYGRWMNWKKGASLDIDVLIGEGPGGNFGAYILYQKQGEDRLRVFSTKPLTEEEKRHLRNISGDVARLL